MLLSCDEWWAWKAGEVESAPEPEPCEQEHEPVEPTPEEHAEFDRRMVQLRRRLAIRKSLDQDVG